MEDAPSSSVLYFHPNKSTENFARLCQFLMTICCDVMREILSHYIKPANLRTELNHNRSNLEKITNKQEKDLLYPPHSSNSSVPPIRSRDLDISILYKILRNLCKIPTHIAGWGNEPRPSDFSLAACIERIRILRNSIPGHSTNGTVDDVKFEDNWRELKKSVVEIEKDVTGNDRYEREIDHLYKCDLNPTKSEKYVAQIQKNIERMDLFEEEANAKRARLDILEGRQKKVEENQAKFKAHLEDKITDTLNDDGRIIPSYTLTYSTSIFRTIRFNSDAFEKGFFSHLPMQSTWNNKCWLLIPCKRCINNGTGIQCIMDQMLKSLQGESFMLYLLSEIGVCKEIRIPKMYSVRSTNIATNEDGEVVFISGQSLVAAGENGEFRKLFDFCTHDKCATLQVFHTVPGNYLITDKEFADFSEFSKEGCLLRTLKLPSVLDPTVFSLIPNCNKDFILVTCSPRLDHVITLDEDFNLNWEESLEHVGMITSVLKNNDLLCIIANTIELLDYRGRFVKTVYEPLKQSKMMNVAYSKNGTIFILYESFEVDIFKLEIPSRKN